MVEVENNRLKDKISKVESDRQDNQITQLERQLLSAKVLKEKKLISCIIN